MAVPRCVRPTDFREIKSREIHIFADASTVSYDSVAYQRLYDNEGHIHCSFPMGKSCLTPIKAVTILHLELTAATLSVRLEEVLQTIHLTLSSTILTQPQSCDTFGMIKNVFKFS